MMLPVRPESAVDKCFQGCGSQVLDALASFRTFANDGTDIEFAGIRRPVLRATDSGAGPTVAAALFAAELTCGHTPNVSSLNAALAGEFLTIAADTLSDANNTAQKSGERNSSEGLSVLLGDFALSRGLVAAMNLGATETVRLAKLTRLVVQAAASEFDTSAGRVRTTEDYLRSAGNRHGSIHAHAASLGARLAGEESSNQQFARFGADLGVALRIANDLAELRTGDASSPTDPESLLSGHISLPVIFALSEDESLADTLHRNPSEARATEVLERIVNSEAIGRSVELCRTFVDSSIASLDRIDSHDTTLLAALATVPEQRIQATYGTD